MQRHYLHRKMIAEIFRSEKTEITMLEAGKAEEGECLRSTAPVMKPLLFYVLMDSSIIQEKKLRIPNKFVKKLRDKLSIVATLVLPNGNNWFVGLREVDDKLWFIDRWHEFVVRYSICAGCLLVFKYEGDSIFKVSIFNLKSCEVDYIENPTAAGKEKQFSVSDGKEIKNDPCPPLPTFATRNNVPEGDNRQVRPRLTRDVGVQVNGTGIDVKRLFKPVALKQTETRKERNEPSNLVKEVEKPRRKIPRTKSVASCVSKTPEKVETVHSAEKVKPSNPQCRIVMRPSFLSHSNLHVPAKFASQFLHGIAEFVMLQDSNGKQWRVRCVPNRRAAKISKGWPRFVKDNHLKVGDVCEFELVEKKNVVLKVTIIRVSSGSVTSETKVKSEVQA